MRGRTVLTILVLLAVVFGLGGYLARKHLGDALPLGIGTRYCLAHSGDQAGREVKLEAEQMSNAATVAAVGISRDLPDRAIEIALATALQESKLRNLGHLGARNDHDSLGLFQQRPSEGWGTEEQVMDPRYASEQFYQALVKIDGWEKMRVTEAAQRVQQSAHPEAYQKWADEAVVLARAFTGLVPGGLTCSGGRNSATGGPAAAQATAERLRHDFGAKAAPLVYDQLHLTFRVAEPRTGWQLSAWLIANADSTGLQKIRFADKEWSVDSGEWLAGKEMADQVVAEILPSR